MSQPPVAQPRPTLRSHHGDDYLDDFAWMNDKQSDEFLAHLAAENAYTQHRTAHLDDLREELYTDILTRTRQTDLTVPSFVRHTDGSAWWYYSRSVEGLDYPIHCRLPAQDADQLPEVSSPRPANRSCWTRTSWRRARASSPSGCAMCRPTAGYWPGAKTCWAMSAIGCG